MTGSLVNRDTGEAIPWWIDDDEPSWAFVLWGVLGFAVATLVAAAIVAHGPSSSSSSGPGVEAPGSSISGVVLSASPRYDLVVPVVVDQGGGFCVVPVRMPTGVRLFLRIEISVSPRGYYSSCTGAKLVSR